DPFAAPPQNAPPHAPSHHGPSNPAFVSQQAPQQHMPSSPQMMPPASPSIPVPAPPAQGGVQVVNADLGAHSATNFFKGLSGNDIIDHGGIFVSTYALPKIGQP